MRQSARSGVPAHARVCASRSSLPAAGEDRHLLCPPLPPVPSPLPFSPSLHGKAPQVEGEEQQPAQRPPKGLRRPCPGCQLLAGLRRASAVMCREPLFPVSVIQRPCLPGSFGPQTAVCLVVPDKSRGSSLSSSSSCSGEALCLVRVLSKQERG